MELELPQLTTKERQKEFSTLFDLGLIVKAFWGGIEMVGALTVTFVPHTFVVKIAELVTQGELADDPDDPIATAIRQTAHTFSIHSHLLLGAYLFLHGAVKLFLVIAIFRGKRWAYPAFMAALAIFGSYELYRGLIRSEIFLIAFAAFDIALLGITAYQYKRIAKTPRKA